MSDNFGNVSNDFQLLTSTQPTFGGSCGISRSLSQQHRLRSNKLTNLIMHTGRLTKLLPDKSSSCNVDTQSRVARKSLLDKLHPPILNRKSLGSTKGSDFAVHGTSEFAALEMQQVLGRNPGRDIAGVPIHKCCMADL